MRSWGTGQALRQNPRCMTSVSCPKSKGVQLQSYIDYKLKELKAQVLQNIEMLAGLSSMKGLNCETEQGCSCLRHSLLVCGTLELYPTQITFSTVPLNMHEAKQQLRISGILQSQCFLRLEREILFWQLVKKLCIEELLTFQGSVTTLGTQCSEFKPHFTFTSTQWQK